MITSEEGKELLTAIEDAARANRNEINWLKVTMEFESLSRAGWKREKGNWLPPKTLGSGLAVSFQEAVRIYRENI